MAKFPILCVLVLSAFLALTSGTKACPGEQMSLDNFWTETEPGTIGVRITGQPVGTIRVFNTCRHGEIRTQFVNRTLEVFVNNTNYCRWSEHFCTFTPQENILLVMSVLIPDDKIAQQTLGLGNVYRSGSWKGPEGTSIVRSRKYISEFRSRFTDGEMRDKFDRLHAEAVNIWDFETRYERYFHARTKRERHSSWRMRNDFTSLASLGNCQDEVFGCSIRYYLFQFLTRETGAPRSPMRFEITVGEASRIKLGTRGYPDSRYNRWLTLSFEVPTPTRRPQNDNPYLEDQDQDAETASVSGLDR